MVQMTAIKFMNENKNGPITELMDAFAKHKVQAEHDRLMEYLETHLNDTLANLMKINQVTDIHSWDVKRAELDIWVMIFRWLN